MIKKFFALFLSLLVLFLFVGCDNSQNELPDEYTSSEDVSATAQSAQTSTTNECEPIDENLKEKLLSDSFSAAPFSDVNEIEAPLSEEELLTIISQTPSDKYEVYPNTHAIPASVTLYKNGEVISIAFDDPRLIQLTNFFNNCFYYSKCSYLQGLYSLDDIEENLSTPFRLELTYVPHGDPASPYGKETTGSDMFVVTNSITAIAHDRSGYDEENYPYHATGFWPLYHAYNWLELFGF